MRYKTLPRCISTATLIAAAVIAPSTMAEGFVEDSNLSSKVRGIYFDRNFYEKESNNRNMNAVGIELNYKSGYINDFIGVGISGYHVQEINTSGKKANDFLSLDSNGDIDSSFSKIGQAYIKLKAGDAFEAKIGRQKVKTMFIASSGTRAIPSTFGGVSFKTKLSGVDFYGLWLNEWSRRHGDEWEDFATQAGGEIDHIIALGAKYKSGNLKVEFETLDVKDYLRKYGLRTSYKIDLEDSLLTLKGAVYTSEDAGELFVVGAESDMDYRANNIEGYTGAETNSSTGFNFDIDWKKGKLGLGASLTAIRGDMWIEDNYTGDHGNNPFSTRASIYPDFTAKNEDVTQARISYDWSDFIPGLTTKFAYNYGSGAENTAGKEYGSADEWYRVMDLKWKIPYVKGLNFRWYSQDYVSRINHGTVKVIKGDTWENRVYLDYVYKF